MTSNKSINEANIHRPPINEIIFFRRDLDQAIYYKSSDDKICKVEQEDGVYKIQKVEGFLGFKRWYPQLIPSGENIQVLKISSQEFFFKICDEKIIVQRTSNGRGAQGFQGSQGGGGGAQGAQGFQGNIGAQGNQGFQGTTGSQGAQGFQGDAGAQGSQGFQGTTGAQGFQGATGAQGNQGFQGATGSQGAQGFQGTTGAQGFQGDTGAQGFQGFQGTTGAQGFQGTTGAQGFQGATGAQGFQGFQGTTGAQGNQGFQGAQGSQGAQGFQGAQGAQGGSSGTFTPTCVGVLNIDSTSGLLSRWIRIGDEVFVSGQFLADATTSLTLTTITQTVPVATANFTSSVQAGGVFSSALNTGASGRVSSTNGAQTVTFTWIVTGVANTTYGYSYSYTVQP